MTPRPRRSALYLPADNARAIDKSRGLDCDIVILDLEDAVAPDGKDTARRQALAAVEAGGHTRQELIVRINGADTDWGYADVAAVEALGFRAAVLVPKISSVSELSAYRDRLGAAPMWAMVETCRAILDIDAIAERGREIGLAGFVIGSNDLAKEMRCTLDLDREALKPAMLLTVMAARAHGLAILDGVFNDINDREGLDRQCRQGVAFGFDGKTLIHPSQIATANRSFSPGLDQVVWSRTVITAFNEPANAGKSVLKIDGRMVERLHLEEAHRTVAIHAVIGDRD